MAKLTQAQKDAYIAELEAKIEEADKIQNDQLNILNINQNKKRSIRISRREQLKRTAQAWLLVALVITLILSIMNMCILSMYMDMIEDYGGYQIASLEYAKAGERK